jgi:imidazolonepropionase-like amidohydrolase
LAKQNGVALVGTEFVVLAPGYSRLRAQVVDRLARAHRIGVTLVYGTDAIDRVPGKTRGEVAITGIEPWVEAGLPASAILQAMTTNATRLLGVDGVRGTLKPGMAADLIATPEDPLTNIQALESVAFVMKDGRVIRAPH